MRVDDVQMYGPIKPAVVNLSYAATVTTDASTGNHFRVTVTGNFTLGNPSSPTDGQHCVWEITQDATGSQIMTLGTTFTVPNNLPAVVLTTTPNHVSMISAKYNGALSKWVVTGFLQDYS